MLAELGDVGGDRFAARGPGWEKVYVIYDAKTTAGKRFRNSELLTVKDGKITKVEVYFGWTTPHKAPPGGFVDGGGE